MNRYALMVLRNLHRFPGAYWKLCHYAKHTNQYPEQVKWDHIHYMLKRATKSSNVDLTVTGIENVPLEGGCMLYGNHQGIFDVFAIGGTCPRPMSIVYKKELAKTPLLKQIFACVGAFPIDREDVRQSLTTIQKVTEEVTKGRAYIIFPEGTRSKMGNTMNPFHGGSFRCATKSKCPVVPMAMIDCFKALDRKGSKKISAQLHYLKPIYYEEYKDLKPAELAELVQSRIQAAIDANT